MASSVDQKLIKRTKFPPEFGQKVNMKKVNIEVMKKWIAGRISELLGNEDDVIIELCFNLLEASQFPDIKALQLQLTGFLDKDAAPFCKELWSLCLSAQSNPQGVPKELLEAKKLELIQEKAKAEKEATEARNRREQERARDRDIDNIRQRERGERGRGRGRGGFRGGRDFDRRRSSRSPPRRRSPPGRRDVDSYVPRGSGRRDDRRRPRSPSPNRSASKSRSPTRSASPVRSRRRSPSRSVSRSPSPARRSRSPDTAWPRSPPIRKQKRRRYSTESRSRSRSRRQGGRDYDRIRTQKSHRKSSPTGRSRSRSPRRSRKHRDDSPASIVSRSSSRPRRRRDRTRSKSHSDRSVSPRRGHRHDRRGRSPTPSYGENIHTRADTRRDRDHGNRRYSRSPKRHDRSESRSPARQRRRLPSVERYEPRAKRRRNTSSPDLSE